MKYKTNNAYVLHARAEIRLKMSAGYNAGCEKFVFGSCDGLLMLTPSTYEVVAVINSRPGNGTFAKFIAHLKALARQHKRDVLVVEIHNPGLGQHLASKHSFTLVPGTRHAFLAVAGPGIVPAVYTQPTKPGPVDSLLSLLTGAAH